MRRAGKRFDVRRVVLRRSGGGFSRQPDYYLRASCDLVNKFKLERPVFGGPRLNTLKAAYRLAAPARVTISVLRGKRVVKRYGPVRRAAAGPIGSPCQPEAGRGASTACGSKPTLVAAGSSGC